MGTVDGADVPAQEMPVATATPLALTLTSPLPVRWQAHFRGSPQATPTFDGFPCAKVLISELCQDFES